MNSLLASIYRHLPPSGRDAAATLYGWYTQRQRYGGQSAHLVEAALAREHWTGRQWETYQQERLAFVLRRAAKRVPYYRAYWAERAPAFKSLLLAAETGQEAGPTHPGSECPTDSADAPWERLENWPVLKKDALRAQPLSFVADDIRPGDLICNHTGGTTGTPLSIRMSLSAVREWYALMEARMRQWHGVSHRDRWAILGGQMVVPVSRTRPPFWVHNFGMHQLYLSTHHLSFENAPAYVQALQAFRPKYLITYPSSGNLLACAMLAQGLRCHPLSVVFSNSEALHEQQRSRMRAAFGCPVVNSYGMGENVAGASECEAGTMHLWPEAGIVEVFADDADVPLPAGNSGRLVITGLLNPDMPLIRYEIGDRGQQAKGDCRCPCGRSLPALGQIEGRSTDMLVTPSGRSVFWLNPVFYDLPLSEGQIVQETAQRIRVLVVPDAGFTESDKDRILARLRERVGDMDISVELRTTIPREANGKFRAVINRVAATPGGK